MAKNEANEFAVSEIRRLVKLNNSLQAKIDALMLEYCPEEMTPEQIKNWEKHQKPSP